MRETYHKVKNLFIYQTDEEMYQVREDWRSHAESVKKGKIFRDDCDGFSLTCAELLYEQKRFEDIRLVHCLTETNGSHLVCYCDGFVLDNRQRTIMDWELVPYTWIKSMSLNEIGVWRSMS